MKIVRRNFIEDESGAVTVDWVVLTAAIVGLGFLVLVPIAYGSQSMAINVGAIISAIQPGYENN